VKLHNLSKIQHIGNVRKLSEATQLEHIQHIRSVRKLSEAAQLEHIQHIRSVRKLSEATLLEHIQIFGLALFVTIVVCGRIHKLPSSLY
jgi:DNA polymerase/3'-5' exonuclease PolX